MLFWFSAYLGITEFIIFSIIFKTYLLLELKYNSFTFPLTCLSSNSSYVPPISSHIDGLFLYCYCNISCGFLYMILGLIRLIWERDSFCLSQQSSASCVISLVVRPHETAPSSLTCLLILSWLISCLGIVEISWVNLHHHF